MDIDRQPDAEDIHKLVAFLPRLYGDEERPLARWVGGGKLKMEPSPCHSPNTARR